MRKPTVPQISKKTNALTRRASGLMALEQRFMFDGAAVDTAVQTVSADLHVTDTLSPSSLVPVAVLQAEQLAQQKLVEFLKNATDEQMFALFNGAKDAPDAAWTERLAELREAFNTGDVPVQFVVMEQASQFNAVAAFTNSGPDGKPTIFVSPYWSGLLGSEDITAVIVEELGHWMDSVLNPGSDTAGDEGQRLADAVMGQETLATRDDATADNGWVTVNGVSYEVEFASFNFVNAYEMVYDQDNDTATGTIDGADIDVTERWADKEQNLHYFNSSTPLGVVSISDGTNGQNFSGNDVSAISVAVNGQTYYGWISRPIKANGVVRGFYFWTDSRFTSLAAAQADGNQDGDSTVLNNRGFVFVVDQAWFNQQITDTKGTTTVGINNQKDGNLGSIWVANVGSSSDRVDSALNSVQTPNSAPAAVNDSKTVAEDSGTTSVSASNGLLSNDSDVNNDALTITSFSVGGVSTTVDPTSGGTYNITNVGSITINKDGSYSFTPVANYSGSVPPITYTVSDGNGGTASAVLSITVTPANDPPISTNDSVSVAINTPKLLEVTDFGTYSDPENDPFTSVKITSLPTSGTLEYWNGTSWTTLTGTPTISITDILLGNLRYVPATDVTGSPTLQFQVYDGSLYSTSSYTLTLNIAGNLAPVVNADTNSVAEAGCGVTAAPATGNVITDGTDDTDPNGNTITVTSVYAYGITQSVASGSTSSSNGTAIAGQYGTLTIGANGTYSYALNNSLSTIDAMNSGDTKTETFTYTVSDGQGRTSSTTLTVTVNGTNDAPVGADDFSTLVEETNATSGVNHGTVTGNALTNDSDVDNTNANLTVKLVDGSTPPAGTTTTVNLYASSPITSVTATATNAGGDTWASTVDTNFVGPVYISFDSGQTWSLATEVDGGNLLVKKLTPSTLAFSDNVALYSYQSATFKYTDSSQNPKTAMWTVSLSNPIVSSGDKIFTTSTNINGIEVGDIVTYSGSTGTIKVTAINTGTGEITLDNDNNSGTAYSVSLTNVALTFSRTTGGISISATQEYYPGTYGYLILNQNGSYTYTLTTDLTASQVVNEQFTYTVVDPANGCVGTAKINIRATGVDAPKLANDTLVVYEDSGTHKTFNGNNSATPDTDTVWSNDVNGTNNTITLGNVTSFQVAGDNAVYVAEALATADSSTNQATIAGVGTLRIYPDGSVSFDPVDNYIGPVPTVTYTRTGSNSVAYTANLTITIDPVNDASVLAADTNTINEDQTAIGNVLSNDSDVDSVLSVSSFSYTSNGSTVSHLAGSAAREIRDGSNTLIGTITINGNGSYTFTPTTNWNGTVPQITYTTNTGSTSTLDITVTPANDPPALDLDNSGPGTGWNTSYTNQGSAVSIGDTDVAIADVDDTNIENATIILTNPQSGDLLNFDASALLFSYGITATSSSSGGVITITLTGTSTLASYQNAIKAITFSSTGFSSVDRVISVKVNDGSADSNTAYTTIDVNPDARALTVTGTTVNEASPYVQFQVGGASEQWVSLAIGTTGSGSGHATMGIDFLPNLQYFNGTSWVDYTGGFVQIPSGTTTLLVGIPVLQDGPYEGAETLKLTAYNQSQWSLSTGTSGNSTIVDDGTGSIYLVNNNLSTPTPTNDPDYPAYLDDDRPVAVNSIVVNEASPYAVLTISGYSGQVLNLAWTDLTAKMDANSSGATDGTDDYGPSLQYWDRTANSNSGGWVAYNGTSVTMSGSTLYVRTNVINDTPFEGSETFALEVTKASSGTQVYGTVSIVDDGTGTKYPDDNPTDGVAIDSSALNDDRTITVTGGLIFNEASPYATFAVSAVAGAEINLVLGNTASTSDVDATIAGFTTSYSEDGGVTWINYTWNGTTGNRPTVPANGNGASVYGTVLVRVNIASEEEGSSDVYEGPETLTLTANYATNTGIASTGIDTIVDDGTGRIDRNGDGDTSDTNEGSGGPGAGYEDDRTIDVVGGLTFNESSPYATFTVTAIAGQSVDLILNDGSSDTATISGFTYQYSLDGGTTWLPGTSSAYNSDFTGVIVAGAGPGAGSVLVRVDISSEEESAGTQDIADVLEGAEPFTFTARYTTNTSKTDTATNTISDDGTGKIDSDGDGGLDEIGVKESDGTDTRTLDVVGGIAFNEASTFATFTVSGAVGSAVNLELGNTTSNTDTDTTISGFTVQYNTGSGWIDYTWNGFTGNRPTVPAGGTFSVRVDIRTEADSPYEGAETFTLKASYATNANISDTDTDTIVDDGTGKIDNDGDGGADEASTKDDDRPRFAINDVTVNEAAGTMTFTVTKTGSTNLASSVQYAFADGTAVTTGSSAGDLRDYAGTAGTLNFAAGDTTKTITVTINDDGIYEGSETFNVNLSNASGATISDAQGTGTIKDDGTGNSSNGGSGTGTDDDRPSFAINDVTVNEAAGTMTFTVTKTGSTNLASSVQYAFADGTAVTTGSSAGDLRDYAGTAGTLNFAAGDTTKTITLTINDDGIYEGSETFNVNLSNASGATISDAQGTGTIKDDGTGNSSNGGSGTGTDDDRPSFAINDVTVNEAAGTMTFTVTKTGSTNLASSVQYAFADGTAVTTGSSAGDLRDYAGTAGTLNFAAGDTTKTITVTINDDGIYEGSETFNVNLSNASGATISDAQGVGTIKDDGTGNSDNGGSGTGTDDDRPSFAINDVTVNEAAGTMTFTVTKTGSTNLASSVQYAFADGTAVTTGSSAGDLRDYAGTAGTLNFAAGDTTKTITVTINDDGIYEGSETFNVNLSNASGATISDAQGTGTIKDDGTGNSDNGGSGTGTDDDRQLTVNSITANEGNGSNYAVFSVGAVGGQTLNLTLADGTAVRTGSGDTLDYGSTLQYWNGSAWTNYSAGFTVPGTTNANANTNVLVRVLLNADSTFESSENFTLTAAYANGGSKTAAGTATIKDDGTGTKFTDGNPTGNDPSTITDVTNLDDDRTLSVTGGSYNENSPRAVFTVNATQGQTLTLDVLNEAGPGKVPTGDNEGKPNDSLDTAPIYYSLDGGNTWQLYNGTPITAASVPVLVAVDISNERDDVYEGEEQLKLVVTSGGRSASSYSSIFDDGTGDIYPANSPNPDPTATKDDDRAKPVAPTPPPPAPAAPPAPQAEPVPLSPVAAPPQVFSSALTPLAPTLVRVEPPALSMMDTVTSASGYQIAVKESAPVGLTVNRGVTDQFIKSTEAVTKISLPFDAFIHSNKDAIIRLEAKKADNSPLPAWVQFDPNTGVFEVSPPKGFKGKLDLKILARDDDGREAVVLFQMFVGDQTLTSPQSRDSFSEKLRMAAGKRPVTLVRVSDVSKAHGRDGAPVRVRAG